MLLRQRHAHGYRAAGAVGVPVISLVSGWMVIQAGFCVSANFKGSIFQNRVPALGRAGSGLREVAQGTDGPHLVTIGLTRGRVGHRRAVDERPRGLDVLRIAAAFAACIHRDAR